MRTERLELGALQTNCWLVSDGAGGPLLVIDPAGEADRLIDSIAGRPVDVVLLTHCHFDHLAAAREVLGACGGRLMIHLADAAWITNAQGTGAALFGFDDTAPPADRELRDGDVIEIGSLTAEVVHTPGHTPGSISLLVGGELFSGDTLFAGSVGRTDFPRGDARALLESVARLAALPDSTVVHPGHGPDTTIGRERRINPFFPRA
jgi:glyoxylase-like metal-dependent hydrolase (beta-lactamase superfamily II)